MRILSLDASTKSTGVAIYEDGKLLHYECITASSTDLVKRIYKMRDRLIEILQEYSVDKIIMEEVLPENKDSDTQKNLKTYKALMYLQAEVTFLLHDNFPKAKLEFVYPSEWRKKCGIQQGRGVHRDTLKARDMEFVKNKFNISVNDDIADAIAIGYSYFQSEAPQPQVKPRKTFNWE